MNILKFKTNINCSGCIGAVTPHLNKAEGVKSWQVDTNNPEKILTVETDGMDAKSVKQVVEKPASRPKPSHRYEEALALDTPLLYQKLLPVAAPSFFYP